MRRHSLLALCLGLQLLALTAGPGDASATQDKITASDAQPDQGFGQTLALDGDTAVVGVPNASPEDTFHAGAAYVFTHDSGDWSERAKLLAPEVGEEDSFGEAVALDGDTLVVGAPGADPSAELGGAGQVYVYERGADGWGEPESLTASDAMSFESFGQAVAIEGDTLAVGEYWDDNSGATQAGAVHVFVRSGDAWSEQQKLVASDAAEKDEFGTAVDLDGDRLVVGASGDDHSDTMTAGSAYLFRRADGNWSETRKLTADTPELAELFGFSVALDGPRLVAGGTEGKAHVFSRTGGDWSHQQAVTIPGGDAFAGSSDLFGKTVALDDDMLLVGAPRRDHNGMQNAGAAWLFRPEAGEWTDRQRLAARDASEDDEFATALAADDGRVWGGAPNASVDGKSEAGAAYAFLPDSDDDGQPDRSDNCPTTANESQTDTDDDGTGDACDNCPDDPNKVAPSTCGCGTADTDTDDDGTADCNDACPDDPGKTSPGTCGCGVPDTDSDEDGTLDCLETADTGPTPDPDAGMMPDTSSDVATVDADAGAGADADPRPSTDNGAAEGGCGCSATHHRPAGGLLLAALLAIVGLAHRHRRR